MLFATSNTETIIGNFGFTTRGPVYQVKKGMRQYIAQLVTNNQGQISNQPCSSRFVRKPEEETTTCEQLKLLTGYLASKKMLVQGHYVIARCAGTDNSYLKMYYLQPMSRINIQLPGQPPSADFSTLADYMSQLEAGDLKYVIFQVVIALKAQHENNMVHGDLNPENILVNFEKGKAIKVQLANPFLATACGTEPTSLTVTSNRMQLPVEFTSDFLLAENKPKYACGLEDMQQLAVLMIDLGTYGQFNAYLKSKQGKAFRDVDLQTDKIAEELQEIADSPELIETISKKLSTQAKGVEGGAQEIVGKRVGAANTTMGGAFGSAEFKKVIAGGLKKDYAKRITMDDILDMDWFRETATELKVDASGVAPAVKKY